MEIKVSDYIVECLIKNNVKDIFGYPGGMVTHFIDSLEKYKDQINSHLTYHEQAASFAACGNSQITSNLGCTYATSGPGATNMITGICQAYFDSIPVLFITGQVNTYEAKGSTGIRQKGFQETDIVSMIESVTKYAVKIEDPREVKYELEKAMHLAQTGRPGPVLVDIPMNVFRTMIKVDELKGFDPEEATLKDYENQIAIIIEELKKAKRPVILAGAGVDISNVRGPFRSLASKMKIPVVTSMLAVDLLPKNDKYNFGFIGAYGHRSANFTVMGSDLIISMGSRLDFRQTGTNLPSFAPKAKIIRLDIDDYEFNNKIKDSDINIKCDLKDFMEHLNQNYMSDLKYEEWLTVCNEYRNSLSQIDSSLPNNYVEKISDLIDENYIITTDVGQNQVWIPQSFRNKKEQRILFSGGHGSMGYSLPAAIGAYYASKKKIISFCGDGGLQMNIQELQMLVRENIPVKIIVLNNSSLGMIRHFQEMYFDSNFVQTVKGMGYSNPDFCAIAKSYGIDSINIDSIDNIEKVKELIDNPKPALINITLDDLTYVYPKLAVNKPIDDQEPLISRELYKYLKKL